MPSHLVSSSVCPSESRGKTCHESSPGAGFTKSQGSGELSQGGSLSRGGRMRAVFWSQSPTKRKQWGSPAKVRSPEGVQLGLLWQKHKQTVVKVKVNILETKK